MTRDQFMRFGDLAPDVVPPPEAVGMETHEWVTTTQCHGHLRGEQGLSHASHIPPAPGSAESIKGQTRGRRPLRSFLR
jgi:hypothetical protein